MQFDAKRKLIRHGLVLFFLGLVIGFIVPAFANPRAGLAAHLEGVMNGTFLIALGVAWSEIHLSRKLSAAVYYLAVYGAYANLVGTGLAAALELVKRLQSQARVTMRTPFARISCSPCS